MSAKEEYEAMVGGLLSKVWHREGEFLTVDPVELNTPLTAVLDAEEGSTRVDPEHLPPSMEEMRDMSREELLAALVDMMESRHRTREMTLKVFMDYLFARGPDPLEVLQRLWVYARACHSGHTWNMKQTEAAQMFGHSKQNWQHIEEALVEGLVRRWSRSAFVNSGGKSVAARLAYSKQRMGNTSRKNGRKAGDDLPPLPAKQHADEPLSDQAKARVKTMREEAERKRMAKLCNCDPSEIDLTKITPVLD